MLDLDRSLVSRKELDEAREQVAVRGKELEEAHRRVFSMRLQSETRQLTNYRELPRMKRHLARLKTIERQRQLARAAGGEAARE